VAGHSQDELSRYLDPAKNLSSCDPTLMGYRKCSKYGENKCTFAKQKKTKKATIAVLQV